MSRQAILWIVIQGILAVVIPLLSAFIISFFRQRGVRLEQEKVDWILDKVIGYVEQKIKQALKVGQPLDGSVVNRIALEYGTSLLKKYGLFEKFGDWLQEGIESRLGQKLIEKGGVRRRGPTV